jgi:hypothetical protein
MRTLIARQCRAALALTSAAALLSSLAPPAAAQQTLSLVVDGGDEIRVSNGSLTIQHFTWQYPWDLVVNGVPQPLAWNGNTSQPVSTSLTGNYWVRRTAGRDGGYAVQRPDGFAIAIADNQNGHDTYAFEFADAPGSNTTDWMYVRSGGGPAGHFDFAGVPGYAAQPFASTTTFEIVIDGNDELVFSDGSLRIRHLSWQHPWSLSINGSPVPLSFNNNLSSPIPLNLPEGFVFTQLSGRAALAPVKTPLGLLIGAADEQVGHDTYRFTIAAVPEPGPVALLGSLVTAGLAAIHTRRRSRGLRRDI